MGDKPVDTVNQGKQGMACCETPQGRMSSTNAWGTNVWTLSTLRNIEQPAGNIREQNAKHNSVVDKGVDIVNPVN